MFGSLSFRLWLTYAILVLVVLCIVAGGLLIYLLRNPVVDRQAYLVLDRVAEAVVRRVEFQAGFQNRMQEAIERIDSNFDVRVLVFQPDSALVADSRSGLAASLDAYTPLPGDNSHGLARDARGQAWYYVERNLANGFRLALATPRRGAVALLFTQRLREIFRDDLLPPLIRAGAVALTLALLLSIWIANWVAAPLRRMASSARQVAEGQYGKIPLQGPNEVRALASALNEMTERVQTGQQSQRDFVANVSHELKTPLTSIQGFAQAILDGTASTPQELTQAAEVIYGEAEQMHRMVLDLLELARLDSGIVSMQRAPLDVAQILNGVKSKFAPAARENQVELISDIGSLPEIVGDADRLAQVFINLVDNALKHTPARGAVEIKARQLGDEIEISVSDNGPGIPAEELPRIFERFYQTDKSRSRGSSRGVGLGLSIAREIVLAHDGSIAAYNNTKLELGTQGSVFVVKLPLTSNLDEALSGKRQSS